MSWLTDNLSESLVIMGLALLAIEIMVLGFSTFILFFIGIAAVITGGILFTGLVDENVLSAVLILSVLTLLLAISLWKPLKAMQDKTEPKTVESDLVGYRFILEQDITPSQYGEHKYSGISWKVKTDSPIAAGSEVRVAEVGVGVFKVVESGS